jgi:hypothetical protein
MIGERSTLTLQGGHMTTLAVRAKEQAIELRASVLATPVLDQDAGELARTLASHEVTERIGGPCLSSNSRRSKPLPSRSVRRCSSVPPAPAMAS